MRTKHILLGLGGLGVAVTALVGALGTGGLAQLGQKMEASVVATRATQHISMGDMMHDALRGDVFQALLYAQTGDAGGLKTAQADAAEHGAEFVRRIDAVVALPLEPALAESAKRLTPLVARYAGLGQELTTLATQDAAAAGAKLPNFLAAFKELESAQEGVIEAIEASAAKLEEDAQATRQEALWAMVGVSLVGALGLAVIALALTRHLMRTLGDEPTAVRRLMGRVAAGDLAVRIDVAPGDQHSILAGLAQMAAQLRGTVGEVRSRADEVASAAAQVASGSGDLAMRTSQQAAALDKSASALEQLSGTVKHNADNAQQANQLAQQASQVAHEGGALVGQMVQTMQDINQSSQRIADIIGVIDGIAFQTNILALNAAVEAARAGEQGRGFAVVANEVRGLAQRSAESAKEIKSLITESVERVTHGAEQAGQAGATMGEIVGAIQRVTDLMAQISTATRQQTAGIGEVAGAVAEMDQSTQSNASLVEETAAAAGSLREQAARLVAEVSSFKTRA